MSDLIINTSEIVRVFPLLFVAAFIAGSFFTAKSVLYFITVLFSKDCREKVSTRPVFYLSWLVTTPLSIFLFFLIHPAPLERTPKRMTKKGLYF